MRDRAGAGANGRDERPESEHRGGGRHIALFLWSLGKGGIGRAFLNLADAFIRRGHRVDLVLVRVEGPRLDQVPPRVKVFGLGTAPKWRGRLQARAAYLAGAAPRQWPALLRTRMPSDARYLPDLMRYLRRERPHALLSADITPNLLAVWASRRARVGTRVVVSERSHLSRVYLANKSQPKWGFLLPAIHRTYPGAARITAVSHGVAEDLARTARLPHGRITTIYNPVFDDRLVERASDGLDHPWFAPGEPPVVLGVGRLCPAKDFPTLLRAFARVRAQRRARLMILGEGKGADDTAARKAELMALAGELGVAADLALPGFVANPWAYMARAGVFALSSAWEGFPNVVAEALACGCPVVSTDCPSGPAEILAGGDYGALVPVGDEAALAGAIAAALDAPPDRARLRARAAEFSVDRAAEEYLRVLFADADGAGVR